MMRAILCMLLLWQTCAPLCMPRPISLPFSLRRFSGRHVRTSVCPVRSVCRISLRCSSDRHACLSACSIRLVCRISLRCSFDWRSRYLHVLAADLRLFSFSWDFDTAFAAAVMAPALIPAMIQTRHDTNWKLVVAKKVFPKDFAMMILWCEYF